jgi:hypothetical protein
MKSAKQSATRDWCTRRSEALLARQFLASKHIADEAAVQVILTLSGRLPLWLATLADARQHGNADIGDPTGNAVERFLKWETDPERREIAKVAALPRALNQDVLTVITPAGKTAGLFGWLRGLPFVSQRGRIVGVPRCRASRHAAAAARRGTHQVAFCPIPTHPDHTSAAAGAARTSSGEDRTVRPAPGGRGPVRVGRSGGPRRDRATQARVHGGGTCPQGSCYAGHHPSVVASG